MVIIILREKIQKIKENIIKDITNFGNLSFSSKRSMRKKLLIKRKNFSVNFDEMGTIKEENNENEKEESYYLYDMSWYNI